MNRGGKIRRGKLTAGLLSAMLAALMTSACGGSSSSSPATTTTTTSTGSGALYTFISDTPSCDVLSFQVFITEMDLHKAGKPVTGVVTVWPTNIAPTSPVIDMSTLRDTMTVLNLTSVPSGTYDQAILRAVVNSASTFDPTKSPPVSKLSATVSIDTVTIDLRPALTVTSGKVSGVKLDLNLPQTLEVDSQGQLTGKVNWVFTANPLIASSSTGFGDMDDLHGFVRSVSSVSPGSGLTSSFLLQTLSTTATGAGPALSVDLNDQTQLIGLSQIDQLTTGSYVEADGYVDENGNLIAKVIQVEDRESVAQQLLGYVGPVLDVTKDPSGNITQFDMLARETQPEDTTDIPANTPITVNVSSSTTFNPYLVSSDLASLASSGNLAVDDTTLTPGQEVIVNGVFSKPSAGPISVAANSVYPRPQAVQGTFSSLVGAPGSDNKTGAFQMTPCGGIWGSNPLMVVTDAQTNFVGNGGLTTLTPTSPLVVRGLTFFNLTGTTITGTGTPVPAGTMVLLAKQVRQF